MRELAEAHLVSLIKEHYENQLASTYLWLAKDFDAAVSCGASEINYACPNMLNGVTTVELTLDFNMHAISLTCRGYAVLAIDSSAKLIEAPRSNVEQFIFLVAES